MRRAATVCMALIASVVAPATADAQLLALHPTQRGSLASGEELVDEVLAAVEMENDAGPPTFVFRRDVELALRYELAARGAPQPLTAVVDDEVSRAIFEQEIGERLLEREATRAAEPPPTAADVVEERVLLEEHLAQVGGSRALVRSVGLTDADFEVFARRRLTVSRYLEHHLARAVEPTLSELHAAYDEERFGAFRAEGVAFAVARAEIREQLLRIGYPRAIRTYLRSIGSRARIRAWDATR